MAFLGRGNPIGRSIAHLADALLKETRANGRGKGTPGREMSEPVPQMLAGENASPAAAFRPHLPESGDIPDEEDADQPR